MSGKYDIIVEQGADFSLSVAVADDNGTATDLTGYSARALMRPTKISSTLSGTFTCAVPAPKTDGNVTMTMDNTTTAALTPGRYYYDLEIYTASDATVTRLLEGKVTVTAEVTRS